MAAGCKKSQQLFKI